MKWIDGLRNRVEHTVGQKFPLQEGGHPVADIAEPIRWGRRALWVGAALVLLWAMFAPLGQGVPASGQVKVEGSRKAVQHLRGGVVEEILVREGDKVIANQPLVRLSETQVLAQRGIVDSQLTSLLAVEARLLAERDGKPAIAFPETLLRNREQPLEEETMRAQLQFFNTRRTALQGEISIAEETIVGLKQQITGLESQEQSRAAQLKLFQEESDTLRPLYEEGFVPRTRMFELDRSIAYLTGQRGEDIANVARIRSQISELQLRILQAKNVFREEVETQLTEVQRQVGEYTERRIATQDELDRVVLRAPVAGTVVDLSVHTVGGVVAPGQKLMDIVPEDQNLLVEVRIPPHLIDSVHEGLQADIHFTALDQTLVTTVPGKLIYLSADSIIDPRTEQSYYLGRVVLTEEGRAKLGEQTIQPGMPADVVIRTAERTFIGYMLKPLLVNFQFAFTER